MLTKIENPDPKLLSDLSEMAKLNGYMAKQTAEDRGDIKFYQSGDGKRKFVRVCETKVREGEKPGPARYVFTLYEVTPPLASAASPAPTILDSK